MEARTRCLMVVLLLLFGASVAVTIFERGRSAGAGFQKVVGGLGFGPVLDLSAPCAFDPRLDGSRSSAGAPLPGAACFLAPLSGLPTYGPLRSGVPEPRGGYGATPPRD